MIKDTAIKNKIQNKNFPPSTQSGILPLSRVLSAGWGVLFFTAFLFMAVNLLSASAENIDVKPKGGGMCQQSQEGIDWDRLVGAIIQVESSGNPNAYNKRSGCIGLMQINPSGALKEWNENIIERYWADETKVSFVPERFYFSITYEIAEKYNNEVKQFNRNDLYNKNINCLIGEWYLHRLAEHYLEEFFTKMNMDLDQPMTDTFKIQFICAAYNGGITRLKSVNYDINKMPKETKNYVRKVLDIYKNGGKR